ncbi:TetR family transcriptional regulator [Corynebacterium poyangense]|uniref:TetR family transcriptional regulator n=1 Tax=Corynebacterium poyangense TaxID=2684405 RepID=A0A7H0SQU3_9CORY|nr:TetR/AcrR family transcriptional regulator [Corynebacterium poyangense]QNQ90918.1 TetR family transcriptional regulator [Corynebacterium poyangense]
MVSTRAEAREATRRAVLDAASQLFDARGFHATTIRDIAHKAGVSVGTVMAAGDKEALLVELFDGLIEERQQEIDAQPPHANSRRVADIVAVVAPFVDLFEERRQLAQTYASILVGGRHSSVVFTDLARRLIEVFKQILTAGGWFTPSDASQRAQALHAAYVGSLFMWAATPERSAADFIDQLYKVFAAICSYEGE